MKFLQKSQCHFQSNRKAILISHETIKPPIIKTILSKRIRDGGITVLDDKI